MWFFLVYIVPGLQSFELLRVILFIFFPLSNRWAENQVSLIASAYSSHGYGDGALWGATGKWHIHFTEGKAGTFSARTWAICSQATLFRVVSCKAPIHSEHCNRRRIFRATGRRHISAGSTSAATFISHFCNSNQRNCFRLYGCLSSSSKKSKPRNVKTEYTLADGLGKPLFWASQADYAGRKPLYIISLLIYITANILLAALPANLAALFILRIFQGFGAASVLSLGAGTVADIIEPKKRASAMSMVLLGPQLGPVLGPLLGGALTGGGSWRWTFWFLGLWTRP